MVRVLGQGALEFGDDLVRTPLCLPATVRPVIPRLRVHHRFSVKNGQFDVLWKALGDLSERLRPGFVQRRTVRLGAG